MITHKFLDTLQQFADNAHEGHNEKLLEYAAEFLQNHIKAIQQGRRTGGKDASFFLKKVAEDKMRTMRQRADYWEAKMFREEIPAHIKELSNELQLLWLRSFRAEFKKTESVGMANMVAEEATARAMQEGTAMRCETCKYVDWSEAPGPCPDCGRRYEI